MKQYYGHIDYTWKVIFNEDLGNDVLKIIEYTGSSVYIPRIHEAVTILDNKYRVIDVCYSYDDGIVEVKVLKNNNV